MHPIFHLLPDAPKPVAPYSHAVEAGAFVFVTGQLATDPDDDSLPVPPGIEAQTHKVMDNLSRVLKGCGLSFADVVCVRIFLTDFKGDYASDERYLCDVLRRPTGGRPAPRSASPRWPAAASSRST